jgi:hypothetical protein
MTTLVTARDLANAPNIREMFAEQARKANAHKARPKRQAFVTYEHPDLGDDPEEDPTAGFHLEAVKLIAGALAAEYPTHGRLVALEASGGLVMIELPPLIVRPACGVVNLAKTPKYQWASVAIRVFGEMLERLRLSRQRFDQADFVGAIMLRTYRDTRNGIVPT